MTNNEQNTSSGEETTTHVDDVFATSPHLRALDQVAILEERAKKFMTALFRGDGDLLKELARCKVLLVEAEVVACVGSRFPIAKRFVWLNRSNTLGYEISVASDDPRSPFATLVIHPDGTALIREREDSFTRKIVNEDELNIVAGAFLACAADSIMHMLKVFLY